MPPEFEKMLSNKGISCATRQGNVTVVETGQPFPGGIATLAEFRSTLFDLAKRTDAVFIEGQGEKFIFGPKKERL